MLKFIIMFSLVLMAFAAQANSTVIENIKQALSVGSYQGTNTNGLCSVVVEDIENGVSITIFEDGAIQGAGTIDITKTLSFPFTLSDIAQIIAEDFRVGVAFLEYTKEPEDQTSSSFLRRLNIDGAFISILEKRKGLFSTPKSSECQLMIGPS